MRKRVPITDRFWAKVNYDGPTMPHMDTPCWGWTAALRRGYGTISRPGQAGQIRAHILSWLIHNGPYNTTLMVLHRCDNKVCTNPTHLYLGTASDNVRDAVDRGLARGGRTNSDLTHCKRGHPFSGDNLRIAQKSDQRVGSGLERVCRACNRERVRESRERRRTA